MVILTWCRAKALLSQTYIVYGCKTICINVFVGLTIGIFHLYYHYHFHHYNQHDYFPIVLTSIL
jgi:hypothetical protein